MAEVVKNDAPAYDICLVLSFDGTHNTTLEYKGIKDYSFHEGSPFLELIAVNGEVTYIPYKTITTMGVRVHGLHGGGTGGKLVRDGRDAKGRTTYHYEVDYLKEGETHESHG